MCEMNYCLGCRCEIPTESGMMCGKCGLAPEADIDRNAFNDFSNVAKAKLQQLTDDGGRFVTVTMAVPWRGRCVIDKWGKVVWQLDEETKRDNDI